MSEPNAHLSPVDRARSEVVQAALRVVAPRSAVSDTSDAEAQAAEGALDLAAIRLVAELEARRAR